MAINRLTAYKAWISDLLNSNYVETHGEFESNYVELYNNQISKVNLVATVVNKMESDDKNYISITLDDGSEEIRLKTWREDIRLLRDINIGEIILVVGKIKKYNEEVYLIPNVVKKMNVDWETARKLELIKTYGKPNETQNLNVYPIGSEGEKIDVEEIKFTTSNLRNEVLSLIEAYEEKEGISLEEVKENLHADVPKINSVIEELIKEGQVYTIGDRFRLLL